MKIASALIIIVAVIALSSVLLLAQPKISTATSPSRESLVAKANDVSLEQ
jgi:hypothetical protein